MPPTAATEQTPQAQLSAAFRETLACVDKQRAGSFANGFGRGEEWGQQVLQQFMPVWFRRFIESYGWSPWCVIDGEEKFFRFACQMSVSEEDFWRLADPFIVYHKQK